MTPKAKSLAIAALLAISASPAIAQNAMTTDSYGTPTPVEEREDDEFPWGLLGLLGLAGLLGLKRRDRDDNDRTRTGTTGRH